MKKSELRRKLREQRRAMKAANAAAMRSAKERLDANPEVQKARRRRNIRRLVILALLLMLLPFIRCDCGPPAGMPAPDAGIDAGRGPPEVRDAGRKPPAKTKPKPIRATIEKHPRGLYENDRIPVPSWLDDYRLQVAARAPRLGACFEGQERPGAVRFGAAVHPSSGTISDPTLESAGGGPALGSRESDCVIGVLSDPPYKLKPPREEDGGATHVPQRVGIVIEF